MSNIIKDFELNMIINYENYNKPIISDVIINDYCLLLTKKTYNKPFISDVIINDYYNGYYIIKNPNSDVGQTNIEIRMITDFDATTRCATLNQPFTNFNYNTDTAVNITMTVQPDYCVLNF